jgi:hypothetical protein
MGQFMDMEEALMKENENLIDKLGFWRLKKLTISFRFLKKIGYPLVSVFFN